MNRVAVVAGLVGLVAASCDRRKGERDVDATGTLRAALAVSEDDPNIQGVAFVITGADGRQYTNTVPLRRGSAGAAKPDVANRVFADWLVVLPAGPYTVRATIIGANSQPVPGCSVGEGQVEVVANVTTEITLVVNCSVGGTGGLDTVVVVNHVPLIDQLTTAPNGKLVCLDQAFAATLTARDLDGDPLAWSFTVTSMPPGVVTQDTCLAHAGGQVAFSSTKPGQYGLEATVSDGRTAATLSFPVYVDPCGPVTCPGLLTGLALTVAPQAAIGSCQCEVPVVAVSPNLAPELATVADVDPTRPPRPVARYVNAAGEASDFVATELLVATADAAALEALRARWNGRVAGRIDLTPSSAVAPKFYRVAIDLSRADLTKLPQQWAKYRVLGQNLLSSEAGMRLVAALVAETDRDPRLQVSVNPVMTAATFATRTTQEDPLGPIGFTRNAYDWSYMRRTGAQDIGTAEAWTFLDSIGALGNRVRMTIPDGGFILNRDLASDTVVDGGERVPQALLCGFVACPWHGTWVAQAAAALPDNDIGAAGPAGPVADMTLLQMPGDVFGYFEVVTTRIPLGPGTGPQIINVSATAVVPVELCPDYVFGLTSCEVLHSIARAFRSAGALVVAAAGNNARSVDQTTRRCPECTPVEATLVVPCELDTVTCVGGLANDSNSKAGPSAFGSSGDANSVDIFGPYQVFMIANPAAADDDLAAPDTTVGLLGGTSFSSAYVAGVAALIWAANPAFDVGDVEATLLQTAHAGSGDPNVNRWVNALGAVMSAAGRDTPPFLRIAPQDTTVLAGETVDLGAWVEELQGQSFDVFWRHEGVTVSSPSSTSPSRISFDTSSWSLGGHAIEAWAIDSAGNMSAVDSAVVVVEAVPEGGMVLTLSGLTTGPLCPTGGPDVGDSELNGGPDIDILVGLRPGGDGLVARVDFNVRETNPGENSTLDHQFSSVPVFTTPPGLRIVRIVSSTSQRHRFTGPAGGFAVDSPECADGPLATETFDSGLLAELRVVGDTPGTDFANNDAECARRCNAKIEDILFRPIQVLVEPR